MPQKSWESKRQASHNVLTANCIPLDASHGEWRNKIKERLTTAPPNLSATFRFSHLFLELVLRIVSLSLVAQVRQKLEHV